MAIAFVPTRGSILICDFDMAYVPPEMRKARRAVVVSPRSYNRRHGTGPGRCVVVPFTASKPAVVTPADVPFTAGTYQSLSIDTWAVCSSVMSVSHARLDRVAHGRGFIVELLSPDDMDRIEIGLRHALGMVASGP